MRLRRLVLAVLATVVVVAAGLVWTVLYTEAGARWVLGVANSVTDDGLSYASVSGNLAQGLEISELAVDTDNVSVTAASAGFSIDIGLVPASITVAPAELDTLEIAISPAGDDTADEGPVDVASILSALSLPIALSVQDLAVNGISVRLDGEELIEVTATELSAYWHDRIEITTLSVTSDAFNADVRGELSLSSPFPVSATLSAALDPGLAGLTEPVSLAAELSGDVDAVEFELQETSLGASAEGRVEDPVGTDPRWDFSASAPRIAPVADTTVELVDVNVASRGWLDGYELESTLTLVSPERADIRLEGAGSLTGLDVSSLTLEHAAGSVRASGRLDYPLAFNGTILLDGFDPRHFSDAWPAGVAVAARASVEASTGAIVVSDGRMDAADFSARFDGTLDTADGRVGANASWTGLAWPPVGAPMIDSREGSLVLDGRLNDWAAEAELFLAAPGVAEGRFRVDAVGTATSAELDIVEGDILGGALDGNAMLDWGDAPSWQARLDANGIATGPLIPAFPGSVSAAIEARSIDGPASARLEIETLTGTILDEPLSGGGTVEASGSRLSAESFRLLHGGTVLALDGDLDSSDGVRFEVSTARLADYTGRVAGDLEANGSIVRRDQRFAVNLAARSDSLRYGEVGLTGFSADISTSDGETHTMSVRSARIEAADRGVDRVELDVLLAPDRQRLDLGLESLGYAIGLELDGAFDDWDRPLESTWRGSLESFDLATPSDRIGELQAPAGLVASAASVALDDFCVGGTDEASLCAGLDWAKDGELEFRGDATRLPLDIVNAFVQTGFDFSQALTGSVRWLVKDSGPTGRVDLRLTAGQVTSDVFPDLDLATDVGVIAFEVEDGQLLEGQLELPLPGTGFVNGQFVLDDIKLGTSSPIEGSLNAQIDDIEVIAVFLPDIEKAAGEISADVEVGGTLGAPLFSGRAALERGALVYFPLGLALDSIELIGRMNNQRGMDLEGSLRAGDGVATIRTSRDSAEDEQPGLHFEISGRNLSVVNLPDMTALANADLELDLKGRRLDINGNIDIPFARIRPRNLAVTRIDESEDVVIVAGELPDAALAEEESPDLEVFGRLGVGLGPDVQVNLDLASASLTGAVDYEWNGDLMPIGQGRYDVVGTVQAFGQVLNITEGSVRFPNVPVDNPNIRVRATREIFGNSQIKRAGILVSGSARRPTIEAYTDPRTTEERALTLLITGNDFDFEKGVGAVDFGTYVAPRLFLSYGVAVFTRDNIVSARYDLTTGWGVRVSSGAKDSGVDMTYRIER